MSNKKNYGLCIIPLIFDFADLLEAKSNNRVLHDICKPELVEFRYWKLETGYSEVGFSLIELLVVFSVIAILTIPALVSYNSYKNSQTLSSAALDIKTFLQLAESRASSQIKPLTGGGNCNSFPLDGYVFQLCGVAGSNCQANPVRSYEVDVQCNGQFFSPTSKSLPTGVTIQNATRAIISFPALGGTVSNGSFDVVMGSSKKTITVQSSGAMQIQ